MCVRIKEFFYKKITKSYFYRVRLREQRERDVCAIVQIRRDSTMLDRKMIESVTQPIDYSSRTGLRTCKWINAHRIDYCCLEGRRARRRSTARNLVGGAARARARACVRRRPKENARRAYKSVARKKRSRPRTERRTGSRLPRFTISG